MKSNSGDLAWYFIWLNSLASIGILVFSGNQVLAQVTPDNTLGAESSVVNPRDATSESIEAGATRGQNLFHSFEEFNVGEDRGVYFANPDTVTDIFSRVTGNNVSNILGTLGVDGAANLFLINPNGIVFGEGASLDVQGSFAATTADGIEFGDRGFFSASDPEAPKLLTINPSAYLFNQVVPGAIVNNSQASADFNPATSFDDSFFGLRVSDGQSLLLLGGDINVDGGGLVASGGRIDLGAIAGEGIVGLNNNGSLNIPDNIARGNVSLSNGARFLVAGDGGGDIAIAAKDISLDSASTIEAGIYSNLGFPDAQAGDLNLNATGTISVKDDSLIYNSIFAGATGKAGNLTINTDNLSLRDRAQISAFTFGQGDSGNIAITANNAISLDDSGILADLRSGAAGNAGNIDITTGSLSATHGGLITSDTRGKGNAGDITIQARNNVTFDGYSDDNDSSSSSNVAAGGVGNGGNINITASSLSLTNYGSLGVSVDKALDSLPGGKGQGGNININVGDTLTIAENSYISAATFGEGDSGNLSITADNSISLDASSYIDNSVQNIDTVGDAGNIDITTGSLSVTNGAQINSFTRGKGNAGDITIQAKNTVTFDGLDSSSYSNVSAGGVGNGGNINITAGSLSLTNGGSLGVSIDKALDSLPGGKGQGGNININVGDTLTIAEGSYITASNSGEGDSGNLSITADNSISLDASSYIENNVRSIDAVGDAGNIDITTGSFSATNGAQINSFTRRKGNAGDINIQATNAITFDGNYSGIFSSVNAGGVGNGGDLNITTPSLSLTNGAELSASVYEEKISANTELVGNAGSVNLTISDILEANKGEISTSSTQSSGGEINITSGEINLRGDSNIRSNIFSGAGGGGNINITADSVIAFDDSDIFTFAADGQGGNITLKTPAYLAENFTINSLTSNPDTLDNNSRADLNATGAVSSGLVSIPDVSFIQNSLNDLPNNSINTDELVANSCVSPVGNRQQGKFIITGTGGLPVRPGNGAISDFATGEVRNVPNNQPGWQRGEAIIEPQGVYRLANGKLVMSRECRK